jgi:predicted nucleic acid-binding protein
MLVLDANILIRGVLGRRVRQLLETYSAEGIRFFAPDVAFNDALKYLPPILRTRGKPDVDVPASLNYLQQFIETVEADVYAIFEGRARQRLRGRDEEDWPVLATALALGCGVWSEDQDFFGTGIAVWNTKSVEIFLASEFKRNDAEPE